MLTLSMKTPSNYFTPKQAQFIVYQNNADELDGWTYKVVDIGNSKGLVAIQVFDEEGQLLGYF